MSRHLIAPGSEPSPARHSWRAFLANEDGATAIEYGMIAAGVALAIITIVFTLGTTISSSFYGELASQFEEHNG